MICSTIICVRILLVECANNVKSQLPKEKAVEKSNKNVEAKPTKDFTEELC